MAKTRPSTQDFIDIEEISQDILLLSDGSACMIIEVAAINFGLFSENEQEATIYAYAQLLNSLTFSIQIVLVSKRKDITEYLNRLDEALSKTESEKVRHQLEKYRDFIKSIVRQGNVLDKKFYIAIPFSALELGISHNVGSLLGQKKRIALPKNDLIDRAVTNLAPKRDHLIRLLARIGLRSRQLKSDELLQFFYDAYNNNQLGITVDFPKQ